MRNVVFGVLGVLSFIACGSSSSSKQPDAGMDARATTDASPDASPDAPAPYPAPFPAPPTAVTGGGPVLAHPRLVPVTFSNDAGSDAAALVDFTNKVGKTAYWSALSEYGVGAGSATTAVALTETAPMNIDDSAIQTWLAGKLDANDPAWPTADANTIYVLYYPAGTTITISSGGGTATSCAQFGAYHSNTTLDASHGSINVAYAVIPRCASFDSLSMLDSATAATSHELVEASTDPYPNAAPAGYQQVDDADLAWAFVLGGGELGDLCAQQLSSFTKFAELPYTVQRFWSNASAAAGHDPCVPTLPNEVYFQAAPVLDTVSLSGAPGPLNGVTIPVGQSKVVNVELFSDAPTSGPWTVQALDYAQLTSGTADLSFSFDRTTGSNGAVLKLTITVVRAGQYGFEPFILKSTLGSATSLWIGIVGN